MSYGRRIVHSSLPGRRCRPRLLLFYVSRSAHLPEVFTSRLATMASARDRFFSIAELVYLVLSYKDHSPAMLVNCQGVCRLWKDTIDQSSILQEKMFFRPVEEGEKGEGSQTGDVLMNPVLETHFREVFGLNSRTELHARQFIGDRWENKLIAYRCINADYKTLLKLPWARDGTDPGAKACAAFARKEASWRRMLVSQPPIRHLHVWYTWMSEARKGQRSDSGGGHQELVPAGKIDVTIGMLWDILEAHLVRGSHGFVTFFVDKQGCDPSRDITKDSRPDYPERQTVLDHHRPASGPSPFNFPRIRFRYAQIWPDRGPKMYQRFDFETNDWVVSDELPFVPDTEFERIKYRIMKGDGFQWFVRDCNLDGKQDRDESEPDEGWRWSRSEGFEAIDLKCKSSFVRGRRVRG